MRALVFALSMMLAASADAAENITLTDGRILKNAAVSKSAPFSITFQHDDGIICVPFEKLTPELQQRFGFDPQKAAQLRAKEAEAKVAQEIERRDKALREQRQREVDAAALVERQKQFAREHPGLETLESLNSQIRLLDAQIEERTNTAHAEFTKRSAQRRILNLLPEYEGTDALVIALEERRELLKRQRAAYPSAR